MTMNDNNLVFGIVATLFLFGIYEFIGIIEGGGRDRINAVHIEQALRVCENNEGLGHIDGNNIIHDFHCNNGAEFSYVRPKVTVKKVVEVNSEEN